MALISSPSATLTIASGSLTGTINGDMSTYLVTVGMDLWPGSRYGRQQPSQIITGWTLNGTTSASFTVSEPFKNAAGSNVAYTAVPFVVDNMAAPNNLIAQNTLSLAVVMAALRKFLGVNTTLDQSSKSIYLDRDAGSGTFGRIMMSLAGAAKFILSQRTVSGAEVSRWAATTDGTTETGGLGLDASGNVTAYGNFGPKASSGSMATATGGLGPFTITSADGSSDAYMAFNVAGVFAAYVGISTDGQPYLGGWSYGANKYRFLTQQNAAATDLPGLSLSANTNANLLFTATGAGTDKKKWTMFASSANQFYMQSANDAFSAAATVFHVNKGASYNDCTFYHDTYVFPTANNAYLLGGSSNYWAAVYGAIIQVDGSFSLSIAAGVTPVVTFDSNDYFNYDRANNIFSFVIGSATKISVNSTALYGPDNTISLGGSSNRFSNLYVVNSPIVGSDQKFKTARQDFTDAHLDAWGEVRGGTFQMLDSVAAKGADHARIHLGYIAQEVEAAFSAHGIDAHRLGLWCEDPEMQVVRKTRRAIRNRTATFTVEDVRMEVSDGVARRVVTTRDEVRPVTVTVPVLGDDGQPLVNRVPYTVGTDVEAEVEVPDEDGVMVRRTVVQKVEETRYRDEPVLHTYVEQEEFDEEYEEQEPVPGEVRLSLRYEQCHVIEAAYQRRRADRIEARLTALEAA